MQFTLTYRGPLKSNGGPKEKQVIRRHFHGQLAELWKQLPLADQSELLNPTPKPGWISVVSEIDGFRFAATVSARLHMYADLRIEFLRPGPPGVLITQGGDIDNRLKTLLDSLKVPDPGALPSGDVPLSGEEPFHCLLEDDALVGSLDVRTDRLLDPTVPISHVILLIEVRTHVSRVIHGNIGLL